MQAVYKNDPKTRNASLYNKCCIQRTETIQLEIKQRKKEKVRRQGKYGRKKEKRKQEGKNEGDNGKLSLFENSMIVTKSKLALLTHWTTGQEDYK